MNGCAQMDGIHGAILTLIGTVFSFINFTIYYLIFFIAGLCIFSIVDNKMLCIKFIRDMKYVWDTAISLLHIN